VAVRFHVTKKMIKLGQQGVNTIIYQLLKSIYFNRRDDSSRDFSITINLINVSSTISYVGLSSSANDSKLYKKIIMTRYRSSQIIQLTLPLIQLQRIQLTAHTAVNN